MATISVLIANLFSLFASFLLHPNSVLTPFSHTIMDMRSKKRRTVLTHARVNFSQSQKRLLPRGGVKVVITTGGGGGGGRVTKMIHEFYQLAINSSN